MFVLENLKKIVFIKSYFLRSIEELQRILMAVLKIRNCSGLILQSKTLFFVWQLNGREFIEFISSSDTSTHKVDRPSDFFSLSQTYFTILDRHKGLHFRLAIRSFNSIRVLLLSTPWIAGKYSREIVGKIKHSQVLYYQKPHLNLNLNQ